MKSSKELKKQGFKTLYIESLNGDFKVTIPASYTVTFGPSVPSNRKGTTTDALQVSNNRFGAPMPIARRMSYALRFYEGKELVAVFTDVCGFRDHTIEIQTKDFMLTPPVSVVGPEGAETPF